MHEIRYIISETSKKVDVEQHTLRYWEEELELDIPRNEMGHRYYREEDIEIFKAIKVLKERGYQLRAIKMLLPDIKKSGNLDKVIEEAECIPSLSLQRADMGEGTNQEVYIDKTTARLEQFKTMMNGLITEAIQNNNQAVSDLVSDEVATRVIKELDYQFRIQEEKEEERYKQFDRMLREMQGGRSEYAITREGKKKNKKGFFTKRKQR